MKVMKAEKYKCSFKGIATVEQEDNHNEFNHSEEVITAFSCQDALSRWLKEMWDMSLSISAPSAPNKVFNYGETYEEFIGSKDVEFSLFEVDKNHICINIKYRERNDFYYEISIIKQ